MENVTKRFRRRQIINHCLNWIFPSSQELCILCGRPVANFSQERTIRSLPSDEAHAFGMCLFCLQETSSYHVEPAIQQLRLPDSTENMDVYSCLPYDHFLRTLIRSWKYDGVIDLSHWFAHVLSTSWGAQLEAVFDYVVPVPSTQDRTQKRGYNHVAILAQHFSATHKLTCIPALTRASATPTTFTQSQTAKGRVDRFTELSGAYQINTALKVCLLGKRVLVVDDIVTTGSTLVHCVEQIRGNGAEMVSGLVIARVL